METSTRPVALGAYPRPDRSDLTPNNVKTADDDTIDIGWNEGVLRDGRPYRAEAWACDGVTSLTVFFSTLGLDGLTGEQGAALLESEGLLRFRTPDRWVALRPVTDASGQQLWSVNAVIGDEDQLYAEGTLASAKLTEVQAAASDVTSAARLTVLT